MLEHFGDRLSASDSLGTAILQLAVGCDKSVLIGDVFVRAAPRERWLSGLPLHNRLFMCGKKLGKFLVAAGRGTCVAPGLALLL